MKLDSASLVWGLIFLALAAFGLWVGTGNQVNWARVSIVAPLLLIAVGVLGLVLQRSSSRSSRRKNPRPSRKDRS
ncbi:hypothetical protein [Aestuariimicrobium ganziense]|uniref:hypothetical protein n=1 Tax=Aestuariimicrobium ganziense TaxID=2773677 RepID=UPI0019443AA4|nr:hypothetical protein [Aestuariimicrobium ganziense]